MPRKQPKKDVREVELGRGVFRMGALRAQRDLLFSHVWPGQITCRGKSEQSPYVQQSYRPKYRHTILE